MPQCGLNTHNETDMVLRFNVELFVLWVEGNKFDQHKIKPRGQKCVLPRTKVELDRLGLPNKADAEAPDHDKRGVEGTPNSG